MKIKGKPTPLKWGDISYTKDASLRFLYRTCPIVNGRFVVRHGTETGRVGGRGCWSGPPSASVAAGAAGAWTRYDVG